jgi:hypothetical protein
MLLVQPAQWSIHNTNNGNESIETQFGKTISLLKIAPFVAANVLEMFYISKARLKELIAKHCCYDTRHDRTNMTDLINLSNN